jgi:hypothetical protein
VPFAIDNLKLPARAISLALAAALVLTGCSGDAESAEPTGTPEPAATQTQAPEPEPVYVSAPLSGVQYLEGTNEFLELPAVQGKIDNVTAALPQLGLSRADVVWVTRVEGGLTRLIAVWHSDLPEAIGPVRSARPTDPVVAASVGGVFVVSDDRFNYLRDLRGVDIYVGREDTELPKETTFRESSRRAPHNLMFRALEMARQNVAFGPPRQHFEFATGSERPSAVAGGEPVNGFTVRYLNASSKWDTGTAAFGFDAAGRALATGTADLPAWLRTQDGRVHNDSSGNQQRARNVIVLENRLDFSIRDRTYGSIPRAMLADNSGVAHIFTDGHYLKANWSKGALTDVIVFTTETGEPVKFAPGNTWFEMMDLDTGKLSVDLMTPAAG